MSTAGSALSYTVKGRWLSWRAALTLPAVLGMLGLFLAPFVVFFVYSFLTGTLFSQSGPLTLDNYHAAFTSHLYRALAKNSAIVGLYSASATVLVGLPVAYWIRFCAGRWQVPILFLFTATLFASYLVRIYAWRTMLGDHGVINSALQGIGITSQPIGVLLFSRFAVVVAMVHIFLPYVIMVLFAAFRSIPVELLDVAEDLGAKTSSIWRRVILPQAAPPIATAFLFVFVLSAADYVTPQFLGGTNGSMLGVAIQQAFVVQGNWPLGAALSVLMLAAFAMCYLITTLAVRLIRHKPARV